MCAERMISSVRPIPDQPSSPYGRSDIPASSASARVPRLLSSGRDVYSSVVWVDVAGSAARDGRGQRRMRDDLYDLMAEVTDENGIDIESLPLDDMGDGLRLIVPLDIMRPTRVVDAFVAGLAAGLREHRRQASELARIRMRACFDSGLVAAHRRGWTGEPLVRAARLIDAQQLREALAAEPDADLVAVVSEPMHEILRNRFGLIAPDCFQQIRVRIKEFDGPAWLLAPRAAGACPHCAYR
jgi:hypothetical protein